MDVLYDGNVLDKSNIKADEQLSAKLLVYLLGTSNVKKKQMEKGK